MTVYEQLKKQIEQDVQALQEMKKRGWLVWPMDRVVKEEDLGRCCYLAEEWLSAEELQALKERVRLDAGAWRRYKRKVSGQ
jgi:hypothetical protein